MSAISLELEHTSPYRRTRLFVKGGRAFFGIWNPPLIALDGDEEVVTIQRGQEGQLDLVAFQVYGDRALWRFIAHANQIDLPLEQVVPGLQVKIPKPTKVRAALLEAEKRGGI